MEDPSHFTDSSLISLYSYNGWAEMNNMIIIRNSAGAAVHSAYVISGGTYNGNIICKAKFGEYGVFQGSLWTNQMVYTGTDYYAYEY